MRKKILIIASLVICLSLSFVVFAVTVDELKEIFLTRQEFEKWANVDCGMTLESGSSIGMSEFLDGIEEKKQLEVYDEAGYQMYRRDILSKEVLQSMEPATRESYSIRRSKELENMPTVPVPPAPASYTPIDWATAGANGTNWMSKILAADPNRYLHEINLPGTHDSGAQYVNPVDPSAAGLESTIIPYAKCQDESIDAQLNMGVRFFDIRLADETDPIVCHGDGFSRCDAYKETSCTNSLKFSDVLNIMKTFLNTNNGETIVMSIKSETGTATTCATNVSAILGDAAYSSIIYSGSSFPKLNDVKGKIVIVSRLSGVNGLGFTGIADNTFSDKTVDGVSIAIEDHYDCSSVDKKGHVKNALGLSGSARTLSNINTDGTTKGTTGGLIFASSYQKIPPETPQTAAGVVNPDFKTYSLTQGKNYGWIVFNFVDADLCKKVWETNP